MRTKAYFDNIAVHISDELSRAQSSIVIAVAWFTDTSLFELLCKKALEKVAVELLLMEDEINGNSGIDYFRLVSAGGKVWLFNESLMHNKFCVIDKNTVINGSYNWTNKAKYNHESIIIINEDVELAVEFLLEFKNLKTSYFGVKPEQVIVEKIKAFSLSNQLLIPYRKENKWGFSNSRKEVVIPCKYDSAFPYYEGLAKVELNGKFGLIDKTGREIVSCICNGIVTTNLVWIDAGFLVSGSCFFPEGLVMLKINDKWGFVDKTGREVIEYKYDDALPFSEGLAPVRLDGKWGFIDKTGFETIECKYDWANSFSEGLAKVKLNGKWGFIDKMGHEMIEYKYDSASRFSEGLALVRLNGKWGFIDITGCEAIECKYDYANSFSEGLANVKLNGNHGFIDKEGRVVIEFKYDNAFPFSEGLAKVALNWESGYIDKTGREVIKYKYKYYYSSFSEGLAGVKLNGKHGFIDKMGHEVIGCKYDYAFPFSEGLAKVLFISESKRQLGYIDKEGIEYWED